MPDILKNTLSAIMKNCNIESESIRFDQIQINILAPELMKTIEFLKDNENCQFRQLTDIAGADYPERANRFEVIYHFLSFKHNIRIRVKVEISENDSIQSITSIFPSANWFEREAFDTVSYTHLTLPTNREV